MKRPGPQSARDHVLLILKGLMTGAPAERLEGQVVESLKTGSRYRLTGVQADGQRATLRRTEPKQKGKRARKAERVARRGKGLL